MAGPIYKLFLVKPKEAWYQLSEEERSSLRAKVREAGEKVGGKAVVMCASGWSNEQWMGFGVEKFPDIEAVQKLSALHDEIDWLRYVESFTILGTEWPAS